MDWSKAKNILLLIFFIFNIFLAFSLRTFYFGESVSQKTISDAIKVLEKSNVKVECEIPRKSVGVWKLKYDPMDGADTRAEVIGRILKTKIAAHQVEPGAELVNGPRKVAIRDDMVFEYTNEGAAETIDITDKNAVINRARKVYRDLRLPFKAYHLDRYKVNDDGSVTVLFIEKFRKFLVYDNYLEITLTNNGITRVICSYKKTGSLEEDRLSGKKLIDAYIMLIKNFEGANNITITGIDLGFKKPSSKSDVKVMSLNLYWRVTLSDGREFYFNAGDGERD